MKKGYRVLPWGLARIVALKHDACDMILGSGPYLDCVQIKLLIKHHECPKDHAKP